MRNLSPNLSSYSQKVSDFPRGSNVAHQAPVNLTLDVPHSIGIAKHSSYSQLNRQTRMIENMCSVRSFMDEQQRVIKDLIKQFQIYVGYREQLPETTSPASCDSWPVYLMHIQSLQSAMKQTYKGKALFSNGSQPPIRVHLEHEGIVTPFDLPNPSLSSMISVQSFLAGVLDHKLPSIELGNACMTDLLNALVEIQDGRSRFSKIHQNLSKARTPQRSLFSTHINSAPLPGRQSYLPSWYDRLRLGFSNFFRPLLPSNAHG
jgi:hypothetical protein